MWILSLLSVGLGLAFSTWLAAYTETVEDRNPALTATGLAVWGWLLRIVVAGSLFILPYVVTSMTALVEHGTQVASIVGQHPSEVATLQAIDPATLAALNSNPADTAAVSKAVGEIARAQSVPPGVALQKLLALSQVPRADLTYLSAYGATVQRATTVAPQEWQRWWWACFGAELAFVPTVFLLRGRWSPKRAREDADHHEQIIKDELAKLGR